MDKSYVIPVLTELRELRAKTHEFTDWSAFIKLKEDDCKFILSRATELIEYLDGKLEDLDHFRDLAISRNNELQQELERSTQLEQRCSELVIDRDKAVEYWTKHCEALIQKHREELAAKDREIYEAKFERDKNSDSVTYWRNLAKTLALHGVHATKETYEYYLEVCKNEYIDTDIAHMYPKIMLNNPCNFCGNCRYYAQMGKDDGDFESICTQHYIKRVDPDDASCKHFKPTYDRQVVIAKPEFPCCDHCNREDCDNCTLCPF